MCIMEHEYEKKVTQLGDEELINAGFLDASESVKQTVEIVRANPNLLAGLSLFMLECLNLSAQPPNAPASPTSRSIPTLSSQLHRNSNTPTAVGPHIISQFEKVHYWHGISVDPPELLYRSDLESNPFPVPLPGTKWFQLPIKTAEGVFETSLNPVWHTVAPMIIALMRKCGIQYSALKAVRFSTRDEDGIKTLGPIVIWIATHPNTTSAEDARDGSPGIIKILEEHKVKGAVVEWYEGKVEKLSGPPLMRVPDKTNPTSYVRRPFTVALGMPIATKEREDEGAEDKNGEPSARVLAATTKHVLCKDTTVDYQRKDTGEAPSQFVRVCGQSRFQHATKEIRALVASNVAEAVRLAEEIVRLEAKETDRDPEQAQVDEESLEIKKGQLQKIIKDNQKLQAFFKVVDTEWNDITRRNIGFVDWAPHISNNVDDLHYTRDMGTIELDPQRFQENFLGNVVDLGGKFTSHELNTMFWPIGSSSNSSSSGFKFPYDRLLKIQGVVTRELLAYPDCYDEEGDPIYIVGKDVNTTDFTVGRYAGLEAYLCNEFGKESIEVAIYNYNQSMGNFSAKGDSGSLIFTGDGRMLAILHSGMPKGLSNHVTYGTLAWWVVKQLEGPYPHADFNRTTF